MKVQTQNNEIRRRVMVSAWSMYKFAQQASPQKWPLSRFGEFLKAAWKAAKRSAAIAAQAAAKARKPAKAFRRTTSAALIRSPMMDALRRAGATNLGEKSRLQSYVISMVGA